MRIHKFKFDDDPYTQRGGTAVAEDPEPTPDPTPDPPADPPKPPTIPPGGEPE